LKRLFWIGLALAIGWLWWSHGSAVRATVDAEGTLAYPHYAITPLESFAIDARVLSRHDYRLDREADLSPTDLALGWGPMADENVLGDLQITQGDRWYHWHASKLPIPRREIETHSANMHMIASDPSIAAALERVQPSDRIHLEGRLVEVRGDDGWHWRSSLSREDTGAGACEVVWVTRLDVL
jgi:hypothetical protein